MAGDFGLAEGEDFNQEADADLVAGDQVEQAEASGVGEGGKERGQAGRLGAGAHTAMIYALTDMSRGGYIRVDICEEDSK